MKYAVVGKPRIDYLVSPSEESGLADEGLYGMPLEILGEENGFYKVKTHYGYTGYAKGKDMVMIDENQLNKWIIDSKFTIIKDIADLLSGPNCKHRSMITLYRGSKIISLGQEEGNFTKVQLLDGSIGYIRSEFIKKDEFIDPFANEEEFRERLIKTALMYMETQYKWGGKTPMGIDCSGLTSMSYMLNGVLIYRDAKLEGDNLFEISRDQLKKGDLIYFPGHIAMYIEDGLFIHSVDRYNGVTLNSLNEDDPLYSKYHSENITMCGSIFRP
jgi:beta-lactamase class A